MKSSRLARAPQDVVFGQALFIEFLHWPSVMQQSVGILGMLDTYLWGPAYPLWQYPVGALLLVALVVGSGLDRARLLIVTGGTVAVATISEMATLNQVGLTIQGRYLLPMLSGALLLAAWIIEQRGAITARARVITRLSVVVTLPIQLHALQVTMTRYQRGVLPMAPWPNITDFNPFAGSWHPKVGSLLPFMSAALGLILLGVLCWRLAAGSDQPATTEHAAGLPGEGPDSPRQENPSGQRDLSALRAVSSQ
jgi:hypothetical protein